MNRHGIGISIAMCFVSANAVLAAPTEFNDCFVKAKDGVLVIGNDSIVWEMELNNGLLTKSICLGGQVVADKPKKFAAKPVLQQGKRKPDAVEWNAEVAKATAVAPEHLRVTVTMQYPGWDLKNVFRVYPGCPAIGCDYFIKQTADAPLTFDPQKTRLLQLGLPGKHWKLTSVEFFDRTDARDTLVAETQAVGARNHSSRNKLFAHSPLACDSFRGNIFRAQSLIQGQGVFIVKEAPCSFVQLHYSGSDFRCSEDVLEVVGLGLAPEDLPKGEWVRGYGMAVGVCGDSEQDFLLALRDYQKKERKFVPERDDMIMMNTWGDRNKDAMIGEEFIKRQIDACKRLGVTILQIDDGWQQGLSKNSAFSDGALWDLWKPEDWQPHAGRFPKGFEPVVEHAKRLGVELGLWFHPSNADEYANWEKDAATVASLYRKYGIRYFKIDGIKLFSKRAERNLLKFFDKAMAETAGEVFFNLDATADNRFGYHYCTQYGNVFLENRYATTPKRYYPYRTLRNLWMLSKYVPAERLQIEFLNKWRNQKDYETDDPFAPGAVPFDYIFALAMPAQPLAWLEGSELPKEGFELNATTTVYRGIQADFHEGNILPIGDEPSGRSWTGFQSIKGPGGYLLVFREQNNTALHRMKTYLPPETEIKLTRIMGDGESRNIKTDDESRIELTLPKPHSYVLYRYEQITPR